MNGKVDQYLIDGCGRCSLYKTPECKVHRWEKELKELRRIALECGLKEEFKWSQPCYTQNEKNVFVVTAFKDYAAIAFFKGSLLKDSYDMLIRPGENSQAARQIRCTSVQEVLDQEEKIKANIYEAIEIEKAGLKVNFKKNIEKMPEELRQKIDEDAAFKDAWENLTPGRQRGYILYFSQAKQSTTRQNRIEKCKSKIEEGKGWNEY